MIKIINKQLDDILADFEMSFFDEDAFFKQKRRERMRPNLSRNVNEGHVSELINMDSFIMPEHFETKKGTLLELENELISGYKTECEILEYKRWFFNIVGLCKDKTEYVGEEVRNIVLDGQIVSSCTYANDGEEISSEQYLDYRHSEDSEQWQTAQLILDRYPRLALFFKAANQPYFVLDTVFDKRDEKWKILELNPFWSSSIFGGDPRHVFKFLLDSHYEFT